MHKSKKLKPKNILLILIIAFTLISIVFLHINDVNNRSKLSPPAISESGNIPPSDDIINHVKEHAVNTDSNENPKDHNLEKPPINHGKNGFDASIIQDFLLKNKIKSDGKKIAFLTFDDGPSLEVTPRILKTLNENSIKATFFVVGNQLDAHPESRKLLMDEYMQGNSIGNHTYSHNPDKLYPKKNVDAKFFMEDLEKNNTTLKSVLGDNFHTRIIRFPGGHRTWNKTAEVDHILKKQGYIFLDWNAMTSDAEGNPKTKQELINRYKHTFKDQDKLVILMHDSEDKSTTADALPDIINDLKSKGYEFETLT
ncbi:polysaccharide deacetylase family protein [Clostridium folliculivorans]|uniref:polysaccharide deacetylase family protein n=1 Tax=Clostridium folliculivorans TaxID=2886038 RepID=UPI0021C42E96|nr:polysaccharide deacetylase family protein [Clostridium folliculivorans]GKU28754.1 hypothetical protein CFB3_08600 [Clostridium folliculivorans]